MVATHRMFIGYVQEEVMHTAHRKGGGWHYVIGSTLYSTKMVIKLFKGGLNPQIYVCRYVLNSRAITE